MESVQYFEGLSSVQWGIPSVNWRVFLFSTVRDTISPVMRYHPVLLSMFSIVDGYHQYCGGYSILWRKALRKYTQNACGIPPQCWILPHNTEYPRQYCWYHSIFGIFMFYFLVLLFSFTFEFYFPYFVNMYEKQEYGGVYSKYFNTLTNTLVVKLNITSWWLMQVECTSWVCKLIYKCKLSTIFTQCHNW